MVIKKTEIDIDIYTRKEMEKMEIECEGCGKFHVCFKLKEKFYFGFCKLGFQEIVTKVIKGRRF